MELAALLLLPWIAIVAATGAVVAGDPQPSLLVRVAAALDHGVRPSRSQRAMLEAIGRRARPSLVALAAQLVASRRRLLDRLRRGAAVSPDSLRSDRLALTAAVLTTAAEVQRVLEPDQHKRLAGIASSLELDDGLRRAAQRLAEQASSSASPRAVEEDDRELGRASGALARWLGLGEAGATAVEAYAADLGWAWRTVPVLPPQLPDPPSGRALTAALATILGGPRLDAAALESLARTLADAPLLGGVAADQPFGPRLLCSLLVLPHGQRERTNGADPGPSLESPGQGGS